MLELRNISKSYKMGKEKFKVLKNISLKFYENEFTSILGPSGSGKTTLLNIIGALDKYDEGDLLINGVSTKNYTDKDNDAYRNYMVGFVFQNYNLIMTQSVLENVMLALTLNGMSLKSRRKKAIEALDNVGLSKHINKLPTELSGGQMQRVAIARALVSDPDIILADEPTGALDSKTSKEIMELLKRIANNKIVIMVTHNESLAKTYSNRIITMQDGVVMSDTGNKKNGKRKDNKKYGKNKKMGFLTSLNLSLHNLLTKKGRTFLTALAGSIGIIGIAIILALANGVNNYVKDMERNSLKDYPVTLQKNAISYDDMITLQVNEKKSCNNDICSYNDNKQTSLKKSNDLKSFKAYLEKHNEINDSILELDYVYDIDLQVYSLANGEAKKLDINGNNGYDFSDAYFKELVTNEELINSKYDLLAGHVPSNKSEIVLVIPDDKVVSKTFLKTLNIKDNTASDSGYSYEDLLNITYKLVLSTDYYKLENGVYKDYSTNKKYINDLVSKGLDLKVVGILKSKDSNDTFMGYTNDLTKYIIGESSKTTLYQKQMADKSKNALTGIAFDGINTLDNFLKMQGMAIKEEPSGINIYPKDYDSKDRIVKFLNAYNREMEDSGNKDKVIVYNDLIKTMIESVMGIVNVVSLVLIALVAISLVVSSIMIAIITYISVLERTKEIGILRALGASKKDIRRVFVAETFIEGFLAGILGIISSLVLSLIINLAMRSVINVKNIAILPIKAMALLVILSILLNVMAGLVPAIMASKKKPVDALRSE